MKNVLLSCVLLSFIFLVACKDEPADSEAAILSSLRFAKTYDYIVVGLGQSGCAAAGRLAENRSNSVLGIELGGRTHRELNGTDYIAADFKRKSNGEVEVGTPWTRFDVPLFAMSIYSPEPAPYPDDSNTSPAKLLGGAAAHNNFIWTRHTKKTHDAWGVPEWTWENTLPYYKRTENVTNSVLKNPPYVQYHGLDGPIKLGSLPRNGTFFEPSNSLFEACRNLGYPENLDFNGPERFGCGFQVVSAAEGLRWNSAHGYLPRVHRQGNLHLALFAQATKILIRNGTGPNPLPVAYGIRYFQNGVYKTALARKEIVLTLSAYLTPHLLMLSGIGDAKNLTDLGIKVWVNNSYVGKNMRGNHVYLGNYQFDAGSTYGSAFRVSDYANQYAFSRSGPWAQPPYYAFAYVCSQRNVTCGGPNGTDPDIMVGAWAGRRYGTSDTIDILLTQISTAAPKTVSQIDIVSRDPFVSPVATVVSRYREDRDAQIFGVRLIRRWFNSPLLRDRIGQELEPGLEYQTDDELLDFFDNLGGGTGHACGSTRFGNAGDPTRVTDPQMRVIGIKGLRIGDTGVMPSVSSHTQASAAMTGDRVAHFILSGQ